MTLIEILVVILIMGVVAAGISASLATSRQSQGTITDQNEAQKWAQRAVDAVVDNMRGFSKVSAVLPNGITVEQWKWNADHTQLIHIATATYYLQDDKLWQSATDQGANGQWICGNDNGPVRITNLKFHYYYQDRIVPPDPDGSIILLPDIVPTSPALAESLTVSVTVTNGSNYATETSWVKFRNKN